MKTRIKISLLVGLTVAATILFVLVIFNMIRNEQLENQAEQAIDEVVEANIEIIYGYDDASEFIYEDETESTYYAELIYLTEYEDKNNEYTITTKEEKIVDWYKKHPSDVMQFANIENASYFIKSVDLSDEYGEYILLAYVNVTGEPELIREINIVLIITAIIIGIIGSIMGYVMGRKLEENELSQRTFFENTSHELKTPLMTINGYAEGL